MTHLAQHKNILFDLGGVILDLNVSATLEAFLNMGFNKELLEYPNNMQTDIFFRYETGKITTGEFRDAIRELSGVNFENETFDFAWCSMLAHLPQKRTELLRSLKEDYKLYMLSNTSPLHIDHFEKMFLETAGFPLKEVFEKCYYSHEIGQHKPDAEAFLHVLRDAGIKAEETLFLDDNIQNVKAARELGFSVIHISDQLRMEDLGYNR